MDDSDINIYFLNSQDTVIELINKADNKLLEKMMSKLYSNDDYYLMGQGDRALIAKWKTNVRYQMSQVPLVPVFGYKQVEYVGEDFPVVLMAKNYSDYNKFIQAFSKIIWVTYRFGFDPISYKDSVFTSDTGWGCTIRVGQMLFLNTLKLHFNTNSNLSLLELVQENLSTAPYSLHKIVECGSSFGKNPGEWYSPVLISHVLQALTKNFPVPELRVHIFMDNILYKKKLHKQKSMLVFIPLMLGIGKIQVEYYESIKFLLSLENSVGIIGGIPKSALYIIGYQDNNLLFLDPHFVQPACTSGQDLINKLSTYQCTTPKLLPITSAESSISVGFYFRSIEDFESFEKKINENDHILHGIINIKESSEACESSETSSEDEYYLL